jgi:hypothetical protein
MATLRIEGLAGRTQVQGFRFLWLRHVTGFNHAKHCAACFRGWRDERVTPRLELGRSLVVDPKHAPASYLCGVSVAGLANNLHVAFRAKPGGRIELPAYGDQRVILTDAEALPIPALPEGYRDLPRSFTTCRNYQFGVAHFGDYAARVAA